MSEREIAVDDGRESAAELVRNEPGRGREPIEEAPAETPEPDTYQASEPELEDLSAGYYRHCLFSSATNTEWELSLEGPYSSAAEAESALHSFRASLLEIDDTFELTEQTILHVAEAGAEPETVQTTGAQ